MLSAFIHRPTLSAIRIAASTEETRFYLCGVYVEIRPGNVTYVAVDGHRMIVRRVQNPPSDGQNTLLGSAIIPLSVAKGVKLPRRSSESVWGKLLGENLSADSILTLTEDLSEKSPGVSFSPIDGSFPDWRRVVPLTLKKQKPIPIGREVTFNWNYLADFETFREKLGLGTMLFEPLCTTDPELIGFRGDPDAFGVLMPKRLDGGPASLPSWVLEEEESPKLEAAE